MNVVEQGRLLLQRLAAEETLSRVRAALASAGLSGVVLKGAWVLAEVYPADALRPITDVDVLVPPAQFGVACKAFKLHGFVQVGGDARQHVFQHAELSLDVDLHHALFPTGTFDLPAQALFERSRPSPSSHLRWPDPCDGFAHLVGHFALNRLLSNNLARSQDFDRVGEHFALSPAGLAHHLQRCGLARAARYTFDVLERAENVAPARGAFRRQVRAALPPDALGDALARLCATMVPRLEPGQPWGALFSCLLEPTLGRAAASAVRRPVSAFRERAPGVGSR